MTRQPERPPDDLPVDPPAEPDAFHRERREHGGAAEHLDDDRLARLTEEERVAAGLDAYDPDEVPDAAEDAEFDVTETDDYQAEEAEIRRQAALGEIGEQAGQDAFPPTRYDDE